uniref:Ig-like domain-containing protein n=1 Tax=Strix occidentalis caurina TaxID=311401 RepID=A0A8D0FQP4_STROC
MCWAKALLLPQAAAGAGAQVQQQPSAETNEGTGVTINCSHPNPKITDYIHWYRQLPGRGPAFLALTLKGSRELQAPPGRLSVAADRRSSALWLARPRRGDAAVYYCALGDTGRGAGAAAGHEPPRLLTLPCSSA